MAAVKVGCRLLSCTSYIFRTVVPKLFVGFGVDEKSLRTVKFSTNFIFPVFFNSFCLTVLPQNGCQIETQFHERTFTFNFSRLFC